MRNPGKARNREGGQAIVMVTLALVAMCGMMGLAVDLGWSYYERKAEQAAADSAALSTARAALAGGTCGASSNTSCGLAGNPSFTDCPAANTTLLLGCNYASYNGFTTGGNNGRQTVSIASDSTVNTPIPAPFANEKCCVNNAKFWVSVAISETVPQLFSVVNGKLNATVSVRATAIIADVIVPGSFVLNNRQLDTSPVVGTGTDLCMEDNNKPSVTDPSGKTCNSGNWASGGNGPGITLQNVGGISLASSDQGGPYAGYTYGGGGKVDIYASSTQVMSGSSSSINDPSSWHTTFSYPAGSPMFDDPMRGKGQLPITTSNLGNPGFAGALGGLVGPINGSTDPTNPTILPPANYWRMNPCGSGCTTPVGSGQPVTLQCPGGGRCYFSFQDPGNASNFSDYIIYGGLHVSDANGGQPVVAFGPGRYTFAGTKANNNFATGVNPSMQVDWGATVVDRTTLNAGGGFASVGANVNNVPAAAADGGVALVFTDLNYPGLSNNIPSAVQQCNCLGFGTSGLYMPDPNNNSNPDTTYFFHGLNPANGLPSELQPFQGVMWWQDQANSYVKYTPQGFVDTSCGSLDSPCTNSPGGSLSQYSPQMDFRLGETPGNSGKFLAGLYGVMYQPRGAWGIMVAYGNQNAAVPLQVFSGALGIDGRGLIVFNNPSVPAIMLTAALVE